MMERSGRWILASIFVVSGILHFAIPAAYARIVPPILPRPKLLVLISGGAEILGGIGLLIPRTRRTAAFGLAVLLVAVFPANLYMAVAHVPFQGLLGNRWLQWLRLPLQIPLIWWAWRYTRGGAALRNLISQPSWPAYLPIQVPAGNSQYSCEPASLHRITLTSEIQEHRRNEQEGN